MTTDVAGKDADAGVVETSPAAGNVGVAGATGTVGGTEVGGVVSVVGSALDLIGVVCIANTLSGLREFQVLSWQSLGASLRETSLRGNKKADASESLNFGTQLRRLTR
ncbi:MAG: hypothetical protein ABSB33_04025 [Tepidisphaeraceae bacterium]